MKTGIYMFTNNVKNNELGKPMRYIGQSINIEDRYKEHRGRYGKSPMYEDFEQLGFENFTFEILVECKPEEMDDFEIYLIKEYDTIWPNGYNLTPGGSGYPKNITELTKERMVEANTGINNPMFGTNEDRIGEGNPMFNKRHSEEARRKIAERSRADIHPTARKIEDKSGRMWLSTRECGLFLGIDSSHISSMIKGKRKVYYYIKHLDLHYLDERPENYEFIPLEELEKTAIPKKEIIYKTPISENSPCSKKVVDVNGVVYNSVKDCARKLGIRSHANLNSWLLGSFRFPPELEPLELKYLKPEHNERRYLKEKERYEFESKEKHTNHYKPTKTKQERMRKIIDKDGNVYESVKECSEKFGINQNNLSGMLSGSRKKTQKVIDLGLDYLP